MRPFALSATCFAVVLFWSGSVQSADPKEITDDIAAARKALNRSGSTNAVVEANAKTRLAAWKKEAENGSAAAQWLYGRCLFNGFGDLEEDSKKAVKWFRKSADQGFALAQIALGGAYKEGDGVKEDLAEAVTWFKKAAAQNEPAGLFNLAECYELGEGVTEDAKEALKLYGQASEKGYVYGTLRLIAAYEDGDGAAKNATEAKTLRTRAKEQIGTTAEAEVAKYLFGRNPIGKMAPEVTGKVGGKDSKLSEHRGKVVVVAFTADWCPPCRADAKNRRALEKRLAGKPFVMLHHDVPQDGADEGSETWGVDSVPRLFVIDTKGVVRVFKLTADEVSKTVDELLAAEAKK